LGFKLYAVTGYSDFKGSIGFPSIITIITISANKCTHSY